jgi:hypothetical protein
MHIVSQASSEEVSELSAIALRGGLIQDQALEKADHMFRKDGQLVGSEVIEVDWKLAQNLDSHEGGSSGSNKRIPASGVADEGQVGIYREMSDAVEDNFDDCVEWIVDGRQTFCELRYQTVGEPRSNRLEQGPAVGEVAIHRLPGHVEQVRHLGEIRSFSVALNAFDRRLDNSINGFFVGRWGKTTPATCAHEEEHRRAS